MDEHSSYLRQCHRPSRSVFPPCRFWQAYRARGRAASHRDGVVYVALSPSRSFSLSQLAVRGPRREHLRTPRLVTRSSSELSEATCGALFFGCCCCCYCCALGGNRRPCALFDFDASEELLILFTGGVKGRAVRSQITKGGSLGADNLQLRCP